jgi:hypothetical protein
VSHLVGYKSSAVAIWLSLACEATTILTRADLSPKLVLDARRVDFDIPASLLLAAVLRAVGRGGTIPTAPMGSCETAAFLPQVPRLHNARGRCANG